VDYSGDSGTSWTSLATDVANSGSQSVTAPNTPSTTCLIRVQNVSGTVTGTSGLFSVVSAPALALSVTTLDFQHLTPGSQQTLKFNVSNSGSGSLSGTISSSKQWARVSPATFSAGTNTTLVSVTVDGTALNQTSGQFTAIITVDAGSAGSADLTVTVTATCVLVKPSPVKAGREMAFFGSGIVAGKTTINVYSLNGDLIKTITDVNSDNEMTWNGRNESGSIVPAGVYLYTHASPLEKGVEKFTIVK
jgi:hypothetical protein